jgi:peptidyl-prolyl isomerase D
VALEIATKLRAIGADAWKVGDAPRALKKWRKAMHYLDVHPVFPEGTDENTKSAFADIWRPLLLNSALAALKADEPSRALEYTDRVLRQSISDADKGIGAFSLPDYFSANVTFSQSFVPTGSCSHSTT